MKWSLYIGTVVFSLVLGCEDAELREQKSRPTDDGSEIPDFDLESIKSVKAGQSVTITIANTSLTIPKGALAEDAEVRLRSLKKKPDLDAIAELGESKGDIIELAIYHKQSEELFASNVLSEPYQLTQELSEVSNAADLKYVVASSLGTNDESVDVVGKSAIVGSTGLVSTEVVTIELSVTNAIVYAVESKNTPSSVIVINDTKDLSTSGGGTVSASGTDTSSENTIDCSNLAAGKWIQVPKNEAVGQDKDFCVMKYEAKVLGVEIGATANLEDPKPESRSSGTPWVKISRNQAQSVCEGLNLVDSNIQGYTLITNSMWQTLARNIETAKSGSDYINWRLGSFTDNADQINRGNAYGGADNGPLAASDDDSKGCIGIPHPNNPPADFNPPPDDCAWSVYKRTHSLSNGEIIWDLAGNVWEFVYDNNLSKQGADKDMSKITDAAGYDMEKWGPIGDHTNKTSDAGRAGLGWGGLNYSGGAIMRGGYANSASGSGIYTVDLFNNDSFSVFGIGFRCAYSAP